MTFLTVAKRTRAKVLVPKVQSHNGDDLQSQGAIVIIALEGRRASIVDRLLRSCCSFSPLNDRRDRGFCRGRLRSGRSYFGIGREWLMRSNRDRGDSAKGDIGRGEETRVSGKGEMGAGRSNYSNNLHPAKRKFFTLDKKFFCGADKFVLS
ncbi:hypothetical protein NPIL_533171 [Nephila pilipes]|uniref:Uncharacterized protein n=1 Tax=Nephila pilipes TaxID=299642 RepID=A0A8X6TTB7_NEPPI|nr:hypothetical protein NPIL_533171 [Nephila pilipes]